MKRREFITLLGGAAAAWPVSVRAQQEGRVRRVGAVLSGAQNDPVYQVRALAFRDTLARLGWTGGQNARVDLRFGAAGIGRIRAHVVELMRQPVDVLVTQ
jgi:putative ABC transport system substrate-binding protein